MLRVDIKTGGYHGKEEVIKNIGFTVEKGELVGLIGANGAGKSTTISAILGLLPHMDGVISLHTSNTKYAYIPEHPVFYEYLTFWEHIELLAAAHSLQRENWEPKAEALLETFHMSHAKHDYISQMSKGMKQKTMLIMGFLAEPELYIIDEPFIGLDPTAVYDFLELLKQERKRGAAILMCTHVLDTAEKICDRFLVVSEGTLLADGRLEQIQETCALPNSSLMECFRAIVGRVSI
jgi:ABC-2 type transport system ATP-binding protein